MFGRSKPAKDSAAQFTKAIDAVVAEALAAGVSPGMIARHFEASAERFRIQAHHASEMRRMTTASGDAVNEIWFQAEKKRLAKEKQAANFARAA
jgi:hypothetical protein